MEDRTIKGFDPTKAFLSGGAIGEFSSLIGEENRTLHDSVLPATEEEDAEGTSTPEQGKTAVDKGTENELKQSEIFKTVDIQDFSDFNSNGAIPTEGAALFMVEQRFLKSAAAVTRLTVGGAGTNMGNVRFVLMGDRIKLASFNQAAFAEVVIPTVKPVQVNWGGTEDTPDPAFIFDQRILNRIADFGDAVIEFQVDFGKSLLVVKAGRTHLEFSTLPESEFIQYKTKLGAVSYVEQVNTDLLLDATRYAAKFIKRDDVQQNFSLVDCRDGRIVSGSYSAVGIYEAAPLQKVPFKVKYEALGVLEKGLQHFGLENTHLFNSEQYHILRDENLYLGFERTQFSFPPVERYLEVADSGETLVVPRETLLSSLSKLSVVAAAKEHPVLCKVEGTQDGATLGISIQDIAGKISQDELKVFRSGTNSDPTSFVLNMESLMVAVAHFDSANVHLSVAKGKVVILRDSAPERFTAHTILSIVA